MANTLDGILVKYGDGKTLTYEEFLKLRPEQLSSKEQELQKTMERLYRLNNRKPPLYHSFPSRDNPLTIDATTLEQCIKKHYKACYEPGANRVVFTNGISDLLGTLAHELKHAEQYSLEELGIYQKYCETCESGLTLKQLCVLKEVQAFTCTSIVCALDCVEKGESYQKYTRRIEKNFGDLYLMNKQDYEKIIKDKSNFDMKNMEEKMILNILPNFPTDYGRIGKIKLTGYDVAHIPESFHLSDDFIYEKLLPALEYYTFLEAPQKREKLILKSLLNGEDWKARLLSYFSFKNRKLLLSSSLKMLNHRYFNGKIEGEQYDPLFNKLLKWGADVNVKGNDGQTVLESVQEYIKSCDSDISNRTDCRAIKARCSRVMQILVDLTKKTGQQPTQEDKITHQGRDLRSFIRSLVAPRPKDNAPTSFTKLDKKEKNKMPVPNNTASKVNKGLYVDQSSRR